MINSNDLNELRRMGTNLYGDKGWITRIVSGISSLTAENERLKAQVQNLTQELQKRN